MGLTVERRPVLVEEIATFDEAAECGTAAVIAPISQIDDLDLSLIHIFGTGLMEFFRKPYQQDAISRFVYLAA